MPRHLVVYGDFNCPYSCLASRRVDGLVDRGVVEVDWRAVEHRARTPDGGIRLRQDSAEAQQEIDDVAGLALDGEQPPSFVPRALSNTRAAVGAYAEAVEAGVERAVRDRLFAAIWEQDRNVSDPGDVRRIVAEMTDASLAPADAETGSPAAAERVREWRESWLAVSEQVVPTLVDADGSVHRGVEALRRLEAFTRE